MIESKQQKRVVRLFLDTHRYLRISPATLVYSMFLDDKSFASMMHEVGTSMFSQEEAALAETIRGTEDPQALVQLLRKPMQWSSRCLLRDKILENEACTLPLIKQRALTSMQDHFIESAAGIFLQASENVSEWVMENYKAFRCEYARSIFSLVVGFRGTLDSIPFLTEEAKRLEQTYPEESYDQGPYLAVQELAARFWG